MHVPTIRLINGYLNDQGLNMPSLIILTLDPEVPAIYNHLGIADDMFISMLQTTCLYRCSRRHVYIDVADDIFISM